MIEKLAKIEKLSRIVSMSTTIQTPLNRAIKNTGGITKLARLLKLSSHNVINQWRKTRVPAEHCPDIEGLSGVFCEELRSDVNWAVLRKSAKTARSKSKSNVGKFNAASDPTPAQDPTTEAGSK